MWTRLPDCTCEQVIYWPDLGVQHFVAVLTWFEGAGVASTAGFFSATVPTSDGIALLSAEVCMLRLT